jgi:yecA family protein
MSEADLSSSQAVAFEQWANVFTAHQAFSHPSELHGALCGRLAAGARMQESDWLALVCEHMGLPSTGADDSATLQPFMLTAYDEALERLKSADMSFRPLLPDDEYAIEQRLEALVSWVRGFLEGMAMSAGESLGQAPDEIRELIEDMVAISQLSDESDEEGQDDESEQHFMEVVEYVRLGALSVFTEFNPPEKPKQAAPTLH